MMKGSTSAYGEFLSVTGVVILLFSAFMPWLVIERGLQVVTNEVSESYSLLNISRAYSDLGVFFKDSSAHMYLIILSISAIIAIVLNVFSVLAETTGIDTSRSVSVAAMGLNAFIILLFYISVLHLRGIISDGAISLNGSSISYGYGLYTFCVGAAMAFSAREIKEKNKIT